MIILEPRRPSAHPIGQTALKSNTNNNNKNFDLPIYIVGYHNQDY